MAERMLADFEQKAQGARCACRGADEYCPCQNAPDPQTRKAWGIPERAASSDYLRGLEDAAKVADTHARLCRKAADYYEAARAEAIAVGIRAVAKAGAA